MESRGVNLGSIEVALPSAISDSCRDARTYKKESTLQAGQDSTHTLIVRDGEYAIALILIPLSRSLLLTSDVAR